MKKIVGALVMLLLLTTVSSYAQIRINSPRRTAERQVENRANSRIDRAIDKGFDKVEEGVGNIFKKKEKGGKDDKQQEGDGVEEEQEDAGTASKASGASATSSKSNTAKPAKDPLKAYSKFDFVPGEKIVATEDFAQDAVGDFPAKWNTNGTGEVVTIEGVPGKWLMLQKVEASFIPEFIKDLPENFTLEFDVIYNEWEKRYAYQRRLYITTHEVSKPAEKIREEAAGRGAMFIFDGGMGQGQVTIAQTDENGSWTDLRGEKGLDVINPDNNGKVFHVALWRQKSRLRVYVDEQKVFDLPRIYPNDVKLNEVRFHARMSNEQEQVFVSNVRLAVGAPDTRSKLITEGKFVTTGITFDVNSATIKPASYAVLKDIATTLSENPAVKVNIIGHTDADGDATKNLDLSKRRAAAVKQALMSEFGIDGSRMETDGKGAAQPVAPNTTPEGKANNRRVEFIKL
jgi:outer membrane protein OmpA-like peptidoglycan-associated protein